MKILDVTPITETAQMPVKKGTLQFLQDAHKELLVALLTSTIGPVYNADKVYAMGKYFSLSYPDSGGYAISIGPVMFLYNNEVYLCAGANFHVSPGQVPVVNFVTTQYTTDADPVTFTDNSTHNVHNIRQAVITAGASGSGVSNLADVIIVPLNVMQEIAIESDKLTAVDADLGGKISALQGKITDEAGFRSSGDTALSGRIDDINREWKTLKSTDSTLNNTVVTATGGSSSITSGSLNYKIIGKTLMMTWNFTTHLTGSVTELKIYLPEGNRWSDNSNGTNIGYQEGAPTTKHIVIIGAGAGADHVSISDTESAVLPNGSSVIVRGTIVGEIA